MAPSSVWIYGAAALAMLCGYGALQVTCYGIWICGLLVTPFLLILARRIARPWEIHAKDKSFAETAERLKADLACDPFAFPTGWYSVLRAGEIQRLEVREVVFCGQKVAVFRGQDSTLRAVDAFCAHLGANLAQGNVIGNSLRCPFHHWMYNGEGKVTGVPWASKNTIPDSACVPAFTVLEQDDQVYLWHSADKQKPTWTPPVCNPSGLPFQCSCSIDIRAKARSIAENLADTAHFTYIHQNTWQPPVSHFLRNEWDLQDGYKTDGITATAEVINTYIVLGKFRLPHVLKIRQLGPAMAHISSELPMGLGRFEMIQSCVPFATSKQTTLTQRFYCNSPLIRLSLPLSLIEVCSDRKIWNEQRTLERPVLIERRADGAETVDASIAKFRRWFRQFEPKREIIADQVDKLADDGCNSCSEKSPLNDW